MTEVTDSDDQHEIRKESAFRWLEAVVMLVREGTGRQGGNRSHRHSDVMGKDEKQKGGFRTSLKKLVFKLQHI